MAYTIDRAGGQQIAETSTVKNCPLGTIVKGWDPTYGEGEFIYLQGIGSTVIGSIVQYDANFLSALETTALATPKPNAVAMSANVANQYGWYQISGQAVAVKATATSFAASAALAAGSGLAIVVASGLIINGAIVVAAATNSTGSTSVRVMINRPHGPSDVS